MRDSTWDLGPSLLPHTGTARLLTDVVHCTENAIEATCRIPGSHPLVSEGRAPGFLGLELGAQAAAVLEALTRRANAGEVGPRIGYLVRVRQASFLAPDLPVDVPLRVTAALEGAAPPMAIYRISVSAEGVDFVQATLSTYSAT